MASRDASSNCIVKYTHSCVYLKRDFLFCAQVVGYGIYLDGALIFGTVAMDFSRWQVIGYLTNDFSFQFKLS